MTELTRGQVIDRLARIMRDIAERIDQAYALGYREGYRAGHLPVTSTQSSDPADPLACRHCPQDGHTTEWHEAHYPISSDPAVPLDVERLMVAVFNADNPGNWPRWDEYVAAFGTPATPPWRRRAEDIAREYDALAPKEAGE